LKTRIITDAGATISSETVLLKSIPADYLLIWDVDFGKISKMDPSIIYRV
jgi:hypothetical protein